MLLIQVDYRIPQRHSDPGATILPDVVHSIVQADSLVEGLMETFCEEDLFESPHTLHSEFNDGIRRPEILLMRTIDNGSNPVQLVVGKEEGARALTEALRKLTESQELSDRLEELAGDIVSYLNLHKFSPRFGIDSVNTLQEFANNNPELMRRHAED